MTVWAATPESGKSANRRWGPRPLCPLTVHGLRDGPLAVDGRIINDVQHPNAAAYRRTADALRARDRDALAELIHDEVVWHLPGTTPLAGEVRGREALFRWFDQLLQVTEGTFTLKEHDVLATDEHVVALSDMSAVREGVAVSVNVVSVMHFRDGQQQERWFHPSDLAVWDALLGGSATKPGSYPLDGM